jgi:ribose transport system ATP-binding protein
VAIARALAQNAKVLVLDEPTSSLTATDVDRLFLVLNDLRRSGVGMIYVSHRLDEIFRISDRVVIMRDGQVVGAKRTAETEPEELVELIVGHRLSDVYSRAKDLVAEPNRLSVEDLRTGHVSGVHFQVRRGEVLGLTGLKGAGQREVGHALFGLETCLQGAVKLDGEPISLTTPQGAIRKGIGFVSANRHDDSLALPLTVRENFFMNPAHRGFAPFTPIHPSRGSMRPEIG